MSNSYAVEFENVSKSFETTTAIEDLSFHVREREFIALVGPSGCGKTTALRIMAGLLSPTKGRVFVRGQEVNGPVKDLSMVFQSPVLLPWRTTLQNIFFVAEMRGENPRPYRERALELIELAGLQGFEDSLPYQLSGGMQQRVSICRALLLKPPILLMDEPFGALDVMTRERMDFELQRIWAATRNTAVLVTHSIAESVLLADRIVVMTGRPGRVKAVIDVNLPRPRDEQTLGDPRLVALCGAVRDQIGESDDESMKTDPQGAGAVDGLFGSE